MIGDENESRDEEAESEECAALSEETDGKGRWWYRVFASCCCC